MHCAAPDACEWAVNMPLHQCHLDKDSEHLLRLKWVGVDMYSSYFQRWEKDCRRPPISVFRSWINQPLSVTHYSKLIHGNSLWDPLQPRVPHSDNLNEEPSDLFVVQRCGFSGMLISRIYEWVCKYNLTGLACLSLRPTLIVFEQNVCNNKVTDFMIL